MLKVIIVDDEQFIAQGLQALIDWNAAGYEVAAVLSDGQEALEYIKRLPVDLVITDVMMPKMTGTETIAKLKQTEGYNIPTIALTANAISGMKEKYMKAGFDGYLSKPIDKLELNRIINDFLNK